MRLALEEGLVLSRRQDLPRERARATRAHRREPSALERVTSSVRLERQGDGPVTFKCSLSILGELSEEERAAVASAAAHCPVRRTLSRGIQFAFEAAPDILLG